MEIPVSSVLPSHAQKPGVRNHGACVAIHHLEPQLPLSEHASFQGLLSFEEFMATEIPLASPYANALLWTTGFQFRMLRACGMHTIQLGVGLHLNGSALQTLVDFQHFGPPPIRQQLATAWEAFRSWKLGHGIQCSQPQFRPFMLVSNTEDMCVFKTKVASQN